MGPILLRLIVGAIVTLTVASPFLLISSFQGPEAAALAAIHALIGIAGGAALYLIGALIVMFFED